MIAKKRHAGETAKEATGFDPFQMVIAGDRRILIAACARYMGMTPRRFIDGWIESGIVATVEEADGKIPLTRRERAALKTLKTPLDAWGIAPVVA